MNQTQAMAFSVIFTMLRALLMEQGFDETDPFIKYCDKTVHEIIDRVKVVE